MNFDRADAFESRTIRWQGSYLHRSVGTGSNYDTGCDLTKRAFDRSVHDSGHCRSAYGNLIVATHAYFVITVEHFPIVIITIE